MAGGLAGPSVPAATDAARLMPDLEDVLQRSLRTLLQDTAPSAAVTAELDALCTRRDDATTEQYQQMWDRVTGRTGTTRPAKPASAPKANVVLWLWRRASNFPYRVTKVETFGGVVLLGSTNEETKADHRPITRTRNKEGVERPSR